VAMCRGDGAVRGAALRLVTLVRDVLRARAQRGEPVGTDARSDMRCVCSTGSRASEWWG
jgi:hypothetical protein